MSDTLSSAAEARAGADAAALSSRCLVCSGALAPHRKLPGLHGCVVCGFVTMAGEVDEAALRALYGADYFHGEEYADYVAEEAELRRNFRRRLHTLARLQPKAERRQLYEVGAAYGFFLAEARGDYERLSGIDISEEAARHAREETGVDVAAGDFLSVSLDEPADLLCMWDTIEHLGRPREFIEKAAELVRPGGLIAVTTGDVSSFNARLRGRRWRMIHPPTHLHYFSRETLSRLLDEAGFDVVHIETAGNVRSVRAIVYALLVLRARQRRLFDLVSRLPVLDKGVSLDLGDIMFVVARRRLV